MINIIIEKLPFNLCNLIFLQALICSSFVPIYCGLIPPSFRGVVSPSFRFLKTLVAIQKIIKDNVYTFFVVVILQ